ncbi:MAG: PTS sugar transporter subunit IIA [Rectinemataceae bacterium]
MQLSVKDAAGILNVSEKTIYRWIKQGLLPSYRINEQFRFNRAELLEWATQRRIQVSPDIFAESGEGRPALPSLSDALKAGGIAYRVEGDDQASVLRAVVEVLNLPEEVDREYLYQVMMARETLGSTGIGDGIAIPHVRNPVVLHVSKPTITLCFLEHPIDFHAIDNEPVDTMFAIVSPTVRAHLHLLSRLGFVLRNPEFKAVVKNRSAREAIAEALIAAESAIPESGGAAHGA